MPVSRSSPALWGQLAPNVKIQLVTVLVTGVTTFMFVPLLAIYLASTGLPLGSVGLIAGLLAFSSQAFSIFIGIGVDRWGVRANMACGFVLRIAGYLLMASSIGASTNLVVLLVSVICIGVGGSLLGLSIKTSLVFASPDHPREMLALRSTFINVGVIAGPALGGLVYPLGFAFILGACVVSHTVLAAILIGSSRKRVSNVAERASSRSSESESEQSRGESLSIFHWISILCITAAFWVVYSQLTIILPIVSVDKTGSTFSISLIYIINGAMCVLLQYVLVKHAFKNLTTRILILVGFLFFVFADVVMAFTSGWIAIVLFVVPFTLAELCLAPSIDQQAITMAPGQRVGVVLGITGAAGAVGTLLGSWGGGFLLQHTPTDVVFMCFAALALVAAIGAMALPKPATRIPQ